MNTYAATFVAGTSEIISKRLKQFSIEQLKITYSDDSFMAFKSNMPESKIANLRFFNNIFVVLAQNENNSSLEQFLESSLAKAVSSPSLPGKRFSLSVMHEGKLQNVNPTLRQKLIQTITGRYGATESAHRPDVELWFFMRSSGFGVFGWKLPHIQFKAESKSVGALRSELAHILGLVAGLDNHDSVLDPFAGSGALLEEALVGFHVKQVIAVEKDKKLLARLMKKPKLEVIEGDATDLSFIKSDSIDKTITDPPWGSFTKMDNFKIKDLYTSSMHEVARVLKPGGVAVILSSANDIISYSRSQVDNLNLVKEYPILVSGHKATIYKLRKN